MSGSVPLALKGNFFNKLKQKELSDTGIKRKYFQTGIAQYDDSVGRT